MRNRHRNRWGKLRQVHIPHFIVQNDVLILGSDELAPIIRKRERFSHELTLAYESGHIIELKETKEATSGDEKRS